MRHSCDGLKKFAAEFYGTDDCAIDERGNWFVGNSVERSREAPNFCAFCGVDLRSDEGEQHEASGSTH